MNHIENIIQSRLRAAVVPIKKQIVLSVKTEDIDQLDAIARTLSAQSGRSTSRNMVIEDAIHAYIQDAKQIFEEQGIEMERIQSENEPFDTVILAAHEEGFRNVFLDEQQWYYVRLSKEKISDIKNVGIYVSAPVSKITHYAKVSPQGFEYDEEKKKYIIHFDGPAIELENPVPLGSISAAATRAPRYTTLQKLLTAEEYKDL